MKCPFNKLRSDLPPLTDRIARLPIDARGYPIPFFVSTLPDGTRDFRMADGAKWKQCIQSGLCWICGQPLGTFRAFILGPMCTITRSTSEPPNHLDCAEWSVKGCPFLAKHKMVRREHEEIKAMTENTSAGISIDRNPGVSAIWVTKSFQLFPDGKGKMLIQVGDPTAVTWWREGRPATRAEVLDSVETGLPILEQACQSKADLVALGQSVQKAMVYLPC